MLRYYLKLFLHLTLKNTQEKRKVYSFESWSHSKDSDAVSLNESYESGWLIFKRSFFYRGLSILILNIIIRYSQLNLNDLMRLRPLPIMKSLRIMVLHFGQTDYDSGIW